MMRTPDLEWPPSVCFLRGLKQQESIAFSVSAPDIVTADGLVERADAAPVDAGFLGDLPGGKGLGIWRT